MDRWVSSFPNKPAKGNPFWHNMYFVTQSTARHWLYQKYKWFRKQWETFPAVSPSMLLRTKLQKLLLVWEIQSLEVAEETLLRCTYLALMLFPWEQSAAVARDRMLGYIPHWGCSALTKNTVTAKGLGKQGQGVACLHSSSSDLCQLLLPCKQIQERSPGESSSV